MTYTGIISAKVSQSEYKVRIPELNKVASALGATPDSELYTARVVSCCGVWPEYKSGELVFVSFLSFGSDSPIILGLQFNEKAKTNFSSAHFTDIEVKVNAKLPEDTAIGKVTRENIKCLINLKKNVDEKFTELDKKDTEHSTTLVKHTTSIEDLDTRVKQNKQDIEENEQSISDLNTKHNDLKSSFDAHSKTKLEPKKTQENSSLIHPDVQQVKQWDRCANKVLLNQLTWENFDKNAKMMITTTNYGDTLPEGDDLKDGQLFFLLV